MSKNNKVGSDVSNTDAQGFLVLNHLRNTNLNNYPCTKYLQKSQGFQLRDDSTWVKHRNKKRCIEGSRKDRFTLTPSPLPQDPVAQHGEIPFPWEMESEVSAQFHQTPEPDCPSTRSTLVALSGSLQAPTNPGPQLIAVPSRSTALGTSHDTRLSISSYKPRLLVLLSVYQLQHAQVSPIAPDSF